MVVVLLPVGPYRAQQLDRGVAEAAGGEAEELRARRVQPLQVVRDHQDGALGGEGAQHGQDGQTQGQPVALEGGLAAAGEGRFQCGALGGGQPVGHLVHDQPEQVGERQEREMGFGLGRRAAQHGPGRAGVIRGQCPQHGRLSYSGRAVEQHAAAVGQPLTGPREQLLPADHQVGAASGRLLEVPSHGHRSPPCVVSWPILGNRLWNSAGRRGEGNNSGRHREIHRFGA